jgi:hypothetical protein
MFAITRRIASPSLEVTQTIDCDEDTLWPPFTVILFKAGQGANGRNIAWMTRPKCNNANKVIMIAITLIRD